MPKKYAVILGAKKSGKTSLLKRIGKSKESFSESYNSTDKENEKDLGDDCAIEFTDTAENTSEKNRHDYFGQDIVILTVDSTQDFKKQSDKLKKEFSEIQKLNPSLSYVLVVTKSDDKKNQKVNEDQINELSNDILKTCNQKNKTHPLSRPIFTSAKNDDGVADLEGALFDVVFYEDNLYSNSSKTFFSAINNVVAAQNILQDEYDRLKRFYRVESRLGILKETINKLTNFIEELKNELKKAGEDLSDSFPAPRSIDKRAMKIINDSFVNSLDKYKDDKDFKIWVKKILSKILNVLTIPYSFATGRTLFNLKGKSYKAAQDAQDKLLEERLLPPPAPPTLGRK